MLSNYQKEMAVNNNIKFNKTIAKLVPHLMDKTKYCIHYRNLKYIVGMGVEITKVHNIISFTQKEWLKEYIDFNTEKIKEAKSEFEKYFLKLMNNAVLERLWKMLKIG